MATTLAIANAAPTQNASAVAARERLGGILAVTRAGCRSRVVATVVRIATPSAPPICWDVLISPDASPASLRLDARERGDRDRDEGEAEPDADQEEAGQQVGDVRAVDRDLREVDEPGGEQPHAAREHGLDAELRHERLRDARRDDRRQRDGEVADPGLERREAEDLLHVEREQEEHPEDDRAEPEADDVRPGRRPLAEEASGTSGEARALLDDEECDVQQRRAEQQADRLAPSPSPRCSPASARRRAASGRP